MCIYTTKLFYGNSRDYYLWIIVNKSRFGPYLPFLIFWALEEGASKPDQKVDPFGGNFGSSVISKSCFQLF